MNDDENGWVGTGESPREAVVDLTPDKDQPGIAWVEGIDSVPNRSTSSDETINADITIIYESRSAKQWYVKVTFEDSRWRAYFVGGKRI